MTYEVCLSCSTYKSGFCTTYTSTPVCTTCGDNGWYRSVAATVSLTQSDGTSGIATYGLVNTATETYNSVSTNSQSKTPLAGTTWYGYAKDNAGRKTTCSKTVKVDLIAPTCGAKTGERTTWANTDVTVGINCSDNYSGCTQGNYTSLVSTEGQTKAVTIGIKDMA